MQRLSIGKVMALMALVAADFAWLRLLWGGQGLVFRRGGLGPGSENSFILDYGLLGMANVLAIVASARRDPRRFLLAGGLAMIVYGGICLRWWAAILGHPASPSSYGLVAISWRIAMWLRSTGFPPSTEFHRLGYRALHTAIRLALLTTPQALATLLAVGLSRRIEARFRARPLANPAPAEG